MIHRLEAFLTPAAARTRAKARHRSEARDDAHGVETVALAAEVADMGDSIEGRVFAATGTFETLTQMEIRMSVEVRGGIFKPAVTNKTQVLVAGEKAGSKLDTAKARGLRILNEAQFRALCERIPITDEMKRRYLD